MVVAIETIAVIFEYKFLQKEEAEKSNYLIRKT